MQNKIFFFILLLTVTSAAALNVTFTENITLIVENDTLNLTNNGTLIASFNITALQNTSVAFSQTVEVNETVLNITLTDVNNISVINQTLNITLLNCSTENFDTAVRNLKDTVLGIQSSCVDEIGGVTDKATDTSRELTECRTSLERAESRNVLNETVCNYDKEGLEKEISDAQRELNKKKDSEYAYVGMILVVIALFAIYVAFVNGWFDRFRRNI